MEKDKKIKVKPSVVVYSLLIIIAVFFAAVTALVYGFGTGSKIAKVAVKYIPFPAAVVDYCHFISIGQLDSNLQSVRNFYESQDFSEVGLRVDFSTEDGEKRLKVRERQLLNKMIEDKVMELLARQKGIRINQKLVSQNVSRKLQEYGNKEEVKEDLARLYNWNLEDFEEKVVRPDMYKDELEKIAYEESKSRRQDAEEKIKKAKQELDSGKEFSETARSYSEGLTAQDGGELGWFKKEQLLPKLAEIAFSLNEGDASQIIESELGYHIINLEEKKSEESGELVRISQIFVRQFSFADWLEEQMKDIKFFVPIKDYYWNQESLTAEFRSEDLKKFEEKILEEFQGDASVMF
jgi:foldase protein PrsA